MHCLVCGGSSPNDACSFHPGNLSYVQTTDGRFDYRDVYRWSCCNQNSLSEVVAGSDVRPEHAPGCTTAPMHMPVAPILVCYSAGRLIFVEECVAALREMAFDVAMAEFDAVNENDLSDWACVVMIPEKSSAQRALELAETMRSHARPPWIIVLNASGSAQGRTQATAAEHVGQACDAICHGVRMYHGRVDKSPFNIFLSYRRADTFVATIINRFLPSWWDQHVLSPGVDWASEIEVGIRECGLFVLLMKGDLPADSYVWRELDLAIKHRRSIAILAFEDEGQPVLSRCGTSREALEWCRFNPPFYRREQPLMVGRHSSGDQSILYFNRLTAQLNWPLDSRDEWAYSNARDLLTPLRDFPRFRFYSTAPWTQVWDLMEPVRS